MFGKILLTIAVIMGAYMVLRARLRHDHESTSAPAAQPPASLSSRAFPRAIAYGLVAVMVAGSLLWLYLDYRAGQEIVTVRVINATTGHMTTYEARRADTDVVNRRFVTLDGRPVALADVDRMELRAP